MKVIAKHKYRVTLTSLRLSIEVDVWIDVEEGMTLEDYYETIVSAAEEEIDRELGVSYSAECHSSDVLMLDSRDVGEAL